MVAQEAMPETQAIPEIPETMVSVVTVVQQAIPETPATRETPETMVREETEATVVMQAIQEIMQVQVFGITFREIFIFLNKLFDHSLRRVTRVSPG